MPRRLSAALLALGLLVPAVGLDADEALGQRPPNCGPDPAFRGAGAEISAADAVAPGTTLRVSVQSGGGQANGPSGSGTVSANGRYVAFYSRAANIVAGDTNGTWDVFVYDRTAQSVERVSVRSDGGQGNGPSFFPSISGDGRFVGFRSSASNLVPGDTNRRIDAVIYDRSTGEIERVSVGTRGAQANQDIETLNLSQNGRVAIFSTTASSLVRGDTNGRMDVYARDRVTNRTSRLSLSNFNQQPNNNSHSATINADGRYVGFRSLASNLIRGDTNGIADVFVFDRRLNRTSRVNVTSGGAEVHGLSFRPTLSANGRFVVFRSAATNMVPGDTNLQIDAFVRDRALGTTRRVTVTSSGGQTNGRSYRPTISGNGRYVFFASAATNLVAKDTNRVPDVFRHDRRTRRTTRVSITSGGRQAGACSLSPRTNGDGSVVVFTSTAGNLVAADTNHAADIFARVFGP